MKRIGIIRETKIPTDNRTPLTPVQCEELLRTYPGLEIYVQPSDLRVFADEEYIRAGATLTEDMTSCDYLFGVKEVSIDTLLPGKHYFFFAHIGKEQPYNQKLCRAMIDKNITLTDYEYLTDTNKKRLVSFSFWAGVMGVYNTMRLFGLRNKLFTLPAPDQKFTVADILNNGRPAIEILKRHDKPIRILITGNGRASSGAVFILDELGVKHVSVEEYLNEHRTGPVYTVATTSELVRRKDGRPYDRSDFKHHPDQYVSDFRRFAYTTAIFIPCHYWQPGQPKYYTRDMFSTASIDVVGDVTCDINGSVECTIRPSTHQSPFYGIDVNGGFEDYSYTTYGSIGVMAVDTLPNAIPFEASKSFGEKLLDHVFPALLGEDNEGMIANATLINNGRLTERFGYLKNYAGV